MKLSKKKKIGIFAGAVALTAIGVVLYRVYGHKPDVVKHPTWRTFNRADGVPKKAFKTAPEANLQTIKQFLLHGEICNSYEADGKFYTGHSKNAPIKSINPFKTNKMTA